jgi:Rrf2 family transcriptional regulator, iron-sulfur cluster assembly transcription factor
MSILFSRQCEYALQAVLFLALKKKGEATSIRELTKQLKTPYHFMAKILQDLTYKGLLKSGKGHNGGFTLAVPATEITFLHIIEAIDGMDFMNNCVVGFGDCNSKTPCPLHDKWGPARDAMYDMIVSKNIAQMAKESKKPQYRIQKEA